MSSSQLRVVLSSARGRFEAVSAASSLSHFSSLVSTNQLQLKPDQPHDEKWERDKAAESYGNPGGIVIGSNLIRNCSSKSEDKLDDMYYTDRKHVLQHLFILKVIQPNSVNTISFYN